MDLSQTFKDSENNSQLTKATPVNFKHLDTKKNYLVDRIAGVSYESCAYIPKWNLIAIGFTHYIHGTPSLGLYDLETGTFVSELDNIHQIEINHVKWVESKNYLVTCSNDKSIRVFKACKRGMELRQVSTINGSR